MITLFGQASPKFQASFRLGYRERDELRDKIRPQLPPEVKDVFITIDGTIKVVTPPDRSNPYLVNFLTKLKGFRYDQRKKTLSYIDDKQKTYPIRFIDPMTFDESVTV